MRFVRPHSKQPLPRRAKRVFSGVLFEVWQWRQKGYDGKSKIFEKLKRQDTSVVIPVRPDGKIVLAREEQPGKAPFWSLLGGRVEKGETPLGAAKRELMEESGYRAGRWSLLGAKQPISKIEWAVYTFLAKGCVKIARQSLDGAEKISLRPVGFDRFLGLLLSGKLDAPDLRLRFLPARYDPAFRRRLRRLFAP